MQTGLSSSKRPRLRTLQAADYTGLAKSTLEKLRVTGGGCPFIRIGRAVLYDPDDLDTWLAEHRRKSTSDNGQEPTRKAAVVEESPHPPAIHD